MQTLLFRCRLANGLHARPACALEQRAARFSATVTLVNQSKSRRGNAKSVLALVGADVAAGDECQLLIEGPDEQEALEALRHFIEHEFEHSDTPLVDSTGNERQPIPVFLSRSTSPVWQGNGVSEGSALAKAVYVGRVDLHDLARQYDETPPAVQQRQLAAALSGARRRLREEAVLNKGEVAQILDAQSQLLEDEAIDECLREDHPARNALAALAQAIDILREPFRQSGSEYLRQRELDVYDLGLRLASQLTGQSRLWMPVLDEAVIVICQNVLTPGQLLMLRGPHLLGIVMPDGGETSHTAILARRFKTPLLCLASTDALFAAGADPFLLAASHGLLLSEPDEVARRWLALESVKQRSMPAGGPSRADEEMISESLVFLDETLGDKHEVIKRLTDNLDVQQRSVSATLAEHAIWQREAVFTTALGFSIAIPHCQSAVIARSSISILRLNEPLDWGNSVAVKLVIMLTLSEHEQAQHMRIFSVLARRLMHESFRERLMGAGTPREMVNLLREEVILLS
ncbi:HPr family phosphocarrier protein [Cedecea sp.]|jgi:fructose-specific PTS system IIA-like component|uniref:HPr family phosphocarrier protein n=1 Tax=Cedecea sp. TaxID=1970739 RepID=UPI002F3F0C70